VSGRLDQRSWETPDHERRSKIEITADEVAPSLRYATAAVTKNERRSPDGAGGGGGSAPAYSASRAVANETPGGESYYDEEPF
jgi:single-strand DNA-binding protein